MMKFDKLIISQSANDIKNIAAPLEKYLKIKYFGYIKIFSDGTHISLGTDASWHQCMYTKLFQHAIYHKKLDAYVAGFHLWSEIPNQITTHIMRDDFNIDHGITLIEKNEHDCEIFTFATTRDNENIVNLYLNNQDLLKKFGTFFKEKASTIINSSLKCDRHVLPKCLEIKTGEKLITPFVEDGCLQKFKAEISFDDIFKKQSFSKKTLSQQELLCCSLLTKGFTSKEIAKSLKISPRTVETYINHAKEKLGAKNSKEMIAIFMKELR